MLITLVAWHFRDFELAFEYYARPATPSIPRPVR
jgi:hypothetical protein